MDIIEKLELPDQTLYLKNGVNHNPSGPASYYTKDTWFWYLNGKPHRYYGPAASTRIDTLWRIHGEVLK
jgi:hypothetical protein